MNFIKNLTSSKILILFFLCFFLGALSIWIKYYSIEIPVVLIILYGIILYIAQKKYFIDLLNSEKNSPYFLGFLFTLFALFHLFIRPADWVEREIFRSLSIALITTVVGLMARQALFSFSSIPEGQREILRSLREELEENINKYNEAQSKILNLLEDYSKSKENILKDEKIISEKYISSLNRITLKFSELEKNFSEKIESLIKSLSEYIDEFQAAIDDVIPSDLRGELSHKFDDFHRNYIKNLEKGVTDFQSSLERVSTEMINKVETDFVPALQKSSEAISSTCKEYSTNVGLYSIDLEENSKKIMEKYKGISESLGDYLTKINSIRTNLEYVTDSFKKQAIALDESFETRLTHFSSELEEINKLIESFIEAVNKRLSAL